jgi:APA family basic amino acid/polyamine antiporter
VIAVLAFVYSFWAMAGSGQEVVYLGFLLLMAGVPVYAWLRSAYGRQNAVDTGSDAIAVASD